MSTPSSLRGVGRGRGIGLPFNSNMSMEMWESRPGHPAGGTRSILKPDPISGYYKLHVKSIPLSWNENSLRNAFQIVGTPVSIFMSQPVPGVPFKWGFVEYETLNEAYSAIERLNNKIVLGNIEVAFARDKYVDDIMEESLYDYHRTSAPTYKQPLGPLDGLTSFKRTVKNDAALSHSWKPDGYEVVLRSNEKQNEEILLQKVLEVYRNPKITPKDKCVVCSAGTFMGCADCSTLYCSVNCQTRDWPSHSRTCKPSTRSDNGSRTDLRGAGDTKQMRQDMTNGFRSAANRFDDRSQQNRSQNRFDDRPQSNDKLQNRFGDRSNDQFTEANQDERSRNNNQSNSDPPRNLFEERKSRYNANKTNSNDSSRGGGQKLRGGAQRNQYERRSNLDRNNTNFNSKLDTDDEKWDTSVKEPNATTNFEKPTTGIDFIKKEEAFIQAADETNSVDNTPVTRSTEIRMKAVNEKAVTLSVSPKMNVTTAVTGPLTVGRKEVVIVLYKEPTMKYVLYVQLTTSSNQFNMLISKLKSIANCSPVSSPTLGDLCVAEFEHAWYRVQVTCLSPLTVKYIDFGNSETTTVDKLFTIPTELKDIPPIAIKIKLADETRNNFLGIEVGNNLTIEPIDQVEDYWVVKLVGVHYPTNGARSDPVTPTYGVPQVTPPSAQNATPSFPKLLPGDTFTEVYVVHRDPNYVSVTTLSRMPELKELTKVLQEAAATAVPLITPQHQSKCLAKWSKTNSWFRGRVVSLEPLKVNFVDNGNTEICNPENLRELPPHVNGCTPLAVRIDSKEETYKHIMQKDLFSVKPLYKDLERNVWIVDVNPIKEETHQPEEIPAVTELSRIPVSVETTQPTVPNQTAAECHPPTLAQSSTESLQTVSTIVNQKCTQNLQNVDIFPSFLPRNQFSTVRITYQDPEEKTGNVYFVGATTLIDVLVDMNIHFSQSTAKDLQISTPQLGDIGLCQFEGLWYRVRVTSVTPTLNVYFMDYGNTDPVTAEGLRMCPESHKDIPELVKKIQLATGTSEKYFNLPLESYLIIKPISSLADGTIVVQVEGESYDVSIPVISESPVVPRVLTSPSPQPALQLDTPSALLQPQYTADVLKQGWTAVFVPDRLDYITNMLHGSLVTQHLPETVSLMSAYHLDTLMDVEPFDSSYKPKVGDVVGCQDRQEWVRGRVQEGEKVELVDLARVANLSNYKRLPAQFITIPYLAATFSLLNMDMNLLNSLSEKTDIQMLVSAVIQTEGGLNATVTLQEDPVEGVVRSWQYNPLACPDPLALGDLVTICNVISSNTIMVVPADNAMSHHTIQLECRKAGDLEKPPKVGDYVACEFSNENMYCRSLVVKVDVNKDQYEVYKIDYGTTNIVNLNSLRPLTNIIRNLPCRATRVQLIGVDKVNKLEMTAESQAYLNLLAEKTLKVARIEFSSKDDGVALVVADNGESVNEKLAELLKPKIIPDLNGKLTLGSIPVGRVVMHQEQMVIITQTEPLYVQLIDQAQNYYNGSHKDIQIHCGDDQSLYNPCQSELCFAKFGDDWYRSLCVQESVAGVSTQMLVDFGNIFSVPTADLRQMLPEFLNFPVLGLACKIKGLPSELSPEQKAKLKSLLAVDETVKVTFESEDAGYYNINIPAVIASLLT